MTNPELEWSFCSKDSTCFAGELSVQNSSTNPTLGTAPRPFPLRCPHHQVIPCLLWLPWKPFQVSADQSCLFWGSPAIHMVIPPPHLGVSSQTGSLRWSLNVQWEARNPISNLEISIPSSSQRNRGWGTAPCPKPCPWLVTPGCIWIYLVHGDICLSCIARLLSNFSLIPRPD